MQWKPVITAIGLAAGSAAVIGFSKRLGVAEWLAERFGVSGQRSALAGSVLRTVAPLAVMAFNPATATYAVPVALASVSEMVSSSIKNAEQK